MAESKVTTQGNQQQDHSHRGLAPWWQSMDLAEGQCWRTALGPLTLYLQRQASEWWLASESRGGTEDQFRLESGEVARIPEDLTYTRFAFGKAPRSFRLMPRLLDRPVVVRTSQPVNIPADQKITFFISTPVCISIELENEQKKHGQQGQGSSQGGGNLVLQEIPIMRLSDTWFGPSTRIGELCYAARTQARNARSEILLRPHRAVSPVTIHNQTREMLAIDKISLPVPFLSMYGRADGTLWTDPLTLEHVAGEGLAQFKIGNEPPEGVSRSDWLAPAREMAKKGGLVRAFVDIFSD